MMPATRDISIYRGDTKALNLTLKRKATGGSFSSDEPIDITGHTFTSQIRATVDASEVLASFDTTITNASEGKVSLTLSPESTQDLDVTNGVWDVQSVDAGGNVQTWIKGKVTIYADVTRIEE